MKKSAFSRARLSSFLLAGLATGVVSSAAHAQPVGRPVFDEVSAQICTSSVAPATVAFANGLLSTWSTANESLAATVDRLREDHHVVAGRGTLLFQSDRELMNELRTVFEARLAEVDDAVGVDRQGAYESFFSFISAADNEPLADNPWWIETRAALGAVVLERMVAHAAKDAVQIAEEAEGGAAALKNLVETGYGVLVVSHGHGNRLASAALEQAMHPGNPAPVRLLAAAPTVPELWNPLPDVAFYVTSTSDRVLFALSSSLYAAAKSPPFPASHPGAPGMPDGFAGHGYMQSYLFGPGLAGSAFGQRLNEMFAELANQPAGADTVAFTYAQSTFLSGHAVSEYLYGGSQLYPPADVRNADGKVVYTETTTLDEATGVMVTTGTFGCGYASWLSPTGAAFFNPHSRSPDEATPPWKIETSLQLPGGEPMTRVWNNPYPQSYNSGYDYYFSDTLEISVNSDGSQTLHWKNHPSHLHP